MPGFADQQVAISSFLAAVRQVRATGQGTPERSYYPAVSALLNGLFGTLRPLRRAITDPQLHIPSCFKNARPSAQFPLAPDSCELRDIGQVLSRVAGEATP